MTFADSISTSHLPTVDYCGGRTYTFATTLSFLTVTGTTLSLVTTNVGDVGTYNVALTISLTNYPAVTAITKNFVATVTCEV